MIESLETEDYEATKTIDGFCVEVYKASRPYGSKTF